MYYNLVYIMYVIGSREHVETLTGGGDNRKQDNKGNRPTPPRYSGIGKKRNVKIIPVLYIYSHTNNLPIKGHLSVN